MVLSYFYRYRWKIHVKVSSSTLLVKYLSSQFILPDQECYSLTWVVCDATILGEFKIFEFSK
jgi:hypothetical protein